MSRLSAASPGFLALALLTAPLSVSEARTAPPPVKVESEQAQVKPLPPAEIDDTLAIGGSEIDARRLATRMTVEVEVNGTGPYRFVVDSGADSTVIGTSLATKLALPPGKRTILHSMTDSQLVERVLVDQLKVGPTSFNDLELPVLRERDLGAEGMIGLDALVEQRLMMDFDKKIITVDDGRVKAPTYDGEIVVTARLRRGQLILTQVKAGGQAVDAVVDTGSEITIGNIALRDKLLKRNAKFTDLEVVGVTGTVSKLQVATVPTLKLGTITLHDVGIAFADVPPFQVFALKNKPALLLGTDLMSTFRRVSLDFLKRRVRFQLRQCRGIAVVNSSAIYTTRIDSNSPEVCK